MADNPFSFMLPSFEGERTMAGPFAGLNPGTGEPYAGDELGGPEQPELLPWGRYAEPQSGPIETLPGDANNRQLTNPSDLRGQRQNPWYPPREAAESGTLMGLIDHLMGVPTRDQVHRMQDERLRQNENEATSAVLKRMMDIREQNPKITPQQLASAIYKDPVFIQNALKHSPQEMSEFIGKVQEQLYGSQDQQKIQMAAPGSHVIQGVKPDGTANVIYKVPEKLGQGTKEAQIVLGGSPEAEKAGIGPGMAKAGERVQVHYRTTPDGRDIVDHYSFPDRQGVTIDFSQRANEQLLASVSKTAGDIRVAQGHILNAADTVNDIIRDIDAQGGARNIGPVGFMLRLGQGVIEQARAIADLSPGTPFDVKAYPAMENLVKTRGLDKMAGDSAVAQSRILALAFELAAAQNRGGQVTQKDVNSAIEQIGANMGSTAQLKSALIDMIKRGVRRQDTFIYTQRDGMMDEKGQPLVPGRLPRLTRDMMIERGMGRFVYSDKENKKIDAEESTTQDEANIPNTVKDSNGDLWDYKGTGSKKDKKNYKKRATRSSSGIAAKADDTGPKPRP